MHTGANEIDGVAVAVIRKRCRRINIRIGADGLVHVSVPKWGATLREGEAFLKSKWPWVLKTRAKVLAKSAAVRLPVTQEELAALRTTLAELNAKWAARVGEEGVAWKIKDVKSLWGCCHWRDRYIVYNSESTIRNSPVRRANWSSMSSCTSMRTSPSAGTVPDSADSWTSGCRGGKACVGASTGAAGRRATICGRMDPPKERSASR